MRTFIALLTGGGLAALGGLVSGLVTNWLGVERDERRHDHERAVAREDRRAQAYVQLGVYLARYAEWAAKTRPLWGSAPPPPLPSEERWRIDALAPEYSSEVRRLLQLWLEQVAKIHNADQLIGLVERSRAPGDRMVGEADAEQQALDSYRVALDQAAAAIREQMHRELWGEA